jgi:hypothetical protein
MKRVLDEYQGGIIPTPKTCHYRVNCAYGIINVFLAENLKSPGRRTTYKQNNKSFRNKGLCVWWNMKIHSHTTTTLSLAQAGSPKPSGN